MVLKSSLIISMLLSVALTAPIELCKVNKVWGEASYENEDTCDIVNLKLQPTSFTMSGFSSGAFLTSNLFAMFNDALDGIAINAGAGPCASFNQTCHNFFNEKYGLAGVKSKPVFMYTGTNDNLTKVEWSKDTAVFYENLGANVKKMWIPEFLHIFPNNVQSNNQFNPPESCAIYNTNAQVVQNCGYNLAFEVFNHLYGEESLFRDSNYQDLGNLYAIDQRPFNTEGAMLADQGFLYVPNSCLNESCRFHVDIHGCSQTIVTYNDTLVRQWGFLEYAGASNIIMLFPQVNHTETEQLWDLPHCWISMIEPDSNHPQIVALSKLIEAVFDRDLLNLGVAKTQNVADMVKSMPISEYMMSLYQKMVFAKQKVGEVKLEDQTQKQLIDQQDTTLIF